MEVKMYQSISKSIIEDISRLSILMRDANEKDWGVFGATYGLLHNGLGCFFIAWKDGKKVAYGMFSHGIADPYFRRLYYFAVEKSARGCGVGKETLMNAISKEVNMQSGCIVTCAPSLQGFYEKLGFEYAADAGDGMVAMELSEFKKRVEDVTTYMLKVDYVFKQKGIPQLESHYKVKLLRHSD